ncbi:MAG: hypothetical protein WBA57_00985 [Elainellaceae cyanobacterium]
MSHSSSQWVRAKVQFNVTTPAISSPWQYDLALLTASGSSTEHVTFPNVASLLWLSCIAGSNQIELITDFNTAIASSDSF